MIRSTILLVLLSAAFVSNTSAEQQTSLKTRAAEATPHYETLPQNIPSEGLKKRRPHSESRHPLRELASRSAHSYSRSANRRTQSRGRDVKRVEEDSSGRVIPDVSLSATHDLWGEKDKRRSLMQLWPFEGLQPGRNRSRIDPSRAPASQEAAQQPSPNGYRRMLLGAAVYGKRELVSERPNGVSELPDPEAAEYLSEHQSKDLGNDVLTAAKLHYNGTHGGPVHPLSTDKAATTEEHATQAESGGSTIQPAGAVLPHTKDGQPLNSLSSQALQGSLQKASATVKEPKQEGYPWYAEYPAPSFPEPSLMTTNKSIYKDLQAYLKEQQAQQGQEGSTSQNTAAVTSASHLQASIGPQNPGDGGKLPATTVVHSTGSGADQTPARTARSQLEDLRAKAKVWMSPQEASLIETHLSSGDVMLEFGAGYSTMWFSQFVKAYYSIEHDAAWFDEIKGQINAARGNVHLQVAPVSKGYKGWGGGFEEGTFEQFEHYIKSVDNFKVTKFDKVLIDGRARAFCAEYVLKFLHPGSLVFIHDYQDRFFYHGVAERMYTKVAETFDGQSVIILRPKPEALKVAAKQAVAKLASA